jgi:hypothetical protein
MNTKRTRLSLACAALAFALALPISAEKAAKPRLSVVAGLEAVTQDAAQSAFGAENAQTVLAMVTAYAIDSGAYAVIGTRDREAAMKELEFSFSEMAQDANQLKLGRMLAAERILSARCSKAGDYFVVQLTLIDVESGAALGNALGKYRNLGTLLESLRSLANACLGLEDQDSQGRLRFISVRNATEFLAALGSDRVITLEAGTYDLSDKTDVKQPSLTWKNNNDGFYPVVKSVSNLTIRSSGGARVVIAPAYGWVLEFQTSRNLRFQGVEFAHRKPGYCLGGVLRFELCEGVEIFDCSLDGSGTYGLELSGSRNLSMDRSRIRNCTYGIMQLFDTSDAIFKDCEFSSNKEFDLISLSNSANVDFSGCDISGNTGGSLVSIDEASYGVVFSSCRFAENRVDRITDNPGRASFQNCVFE